MNYGEGRFESVFFYKTRFITNYPRFILGMGRCVNIINQPLWLMLPIVYAIFIHAVFQFRVPVDMFGFSLIMRRSRFKSCQIGNSL